MRLEDLIQRSDDLPVSGEAGGVIVSSRIRLARNIDRAAFPGWAGKEERRSIATRLREAVQGLPQFKDGLFIDVQALDPVDSLILQERHFVSAHLATRGDGGGVVISADESLAVMINEEDHLRLAAIRPGMALAEALAAIDAVDSTLEETLTYAYSDRFGYLTACPSNVGTGLRASVMLHLPALRIVGDLEALMRGLKKLGLAVRGSLGEGTDAWGNMFQVSNQMTLGESETDTVARISEVVQEVAQHEQNARDRLLADSVPRLRDHVGRALAILRSALILSSREALDHLSAVRLGVDLGLIENVDRDVLLRLMVLTQPGHLQRILRKAACPTDRDLQRSELIRRHLGDASI